MENKEYWICPECGSEVDLDKNGCWRCRFVTDDVSKYKYNWKAEFVSNIKIMSIVITSLISFIALSVFLIMCINNYYVEKQTEEARIAMEKEALKEQQHRDLVERMAERKRESDEQNRKMLNNRFQLKQNNVLQRISNLENQYNNLLTNYGRANGGYEKIQIRKELERILESINYIAIKEHLSDKKINNIQSKVYNDILRRYGHM